MLNTFPYQKKKKWEGTHPGTHKRHCRECRLTVLASASGELFIAKSWLSVVKEKKERIEYWKPCIIRKLYFKQWFLNVIFLSKFPPDLTNKESIDNLVFNFFLCHLLTCRNNVKDWIRALSGSHKQTRDNKQNELLHTAMIKMTNWLWLYITTSYSYRSSQRTWA